MPKTTTPAAVPAAAPPVRKPESPKVRTARADVNAAATEFETARQAYAAAGNKLQAAQDALAAAQAAK